MAHNDDDGPSRFSYLEVDDPVPRAVREAERVTAEERRRAGEIAHAQELARLERERTEEVERRATARKERRGERAKQRRTINKAEGRLNTWLSKIGRKYHESRAELIDEILIEAANQGFEQTGDIRGENNRLLYVMVDNEGREYGLLISLYHMPSGRWEVTSYIS